VAADFLRVRPVNRGGAARWWLYDLAPTWPVPGPYLAVAVLGIVGGSQLSEWATA
jgi:hypothetical protein